jgi:hypothetical protein
MRAFAAFVVASRCPSFLRCTTSLAQRSVLGIFVFFSLFYLLFLSSFFSRPFVPSFLRSRLVLASNGRLSEMPQK